MIAIISLLSSIVLASLRQAKDKAKDATIQSNLSGIRSQAEIQFSDLGCYTNTGTACSATSLFAAAPCPPAGVANIFGQTKIAEQITAAKNAAAGSGSFNSCASTAGGTAWAVAVVLRKADVNGFHGWAWCVDSTGASREVSAPFYLQYTQAVLNNDISGGVCGT